MANVTHDMLIEAPKRIAALKPIEVKAPEKKEDLWAEVRGMCDCDNMMIADLEASGITSFGNLSAFFRNNHPPEDHTDELAKLKAKIEPIEKLLAIMKQRSDNSAT